MLVDRALLVPPIPTLSKLQTIGLVKDVSAKQDIFKLHLMLIHPRALHVLQESFPTLA